MHLPSVIANAQIRESQPSTSLLFRIATNRLFSSSPNLLKGLESLMVFFCNFELFMSLISHVPGLHTHMERMTMCKVTAHLDT